MGAEIDVKESDGKVYQASVLKLEGSKCLVHFKGWASSWDEWLEIPELSESIGKEVKVLSQKAPAKSDKRKHSSSSSASSSSPPNQNEPQPKKLKPEGVSEIDISKDVEVSMSTPPLNNSLDESLNKTATSSEISETPAQEQTKSVPTVASSSKAFPIQKTSSKKASNPDERQKTILSFFKKFDPAARTPPQLKSKKIMKLVEEDSDEVKILEKVSPQKMLDQKGEEKELAKKVEVVSSPLGFFKLAGEEIKHKEVEKSSAKFTCQHCKMTFSNMLTWKSHEDGHVQVKIKTFLNFHLGLSS